MTDQADTPDPIGAIRARWSRNGGMGNDRSVEDYTDAGCRILARAAFRDFATLDLAMRAMRAEIARLTAELAAARDREAAVRALCEAAQAKADHGGRCACSNYGPPLSAILAALSVQSEQPTKGASE